MCQPSNRNQPTAIPKLPPANDRNRPLFALGRVVSTWGALEHFVTNGIDPIPFIHRHQCGDWGTVCRADARENDLSVLNGLRVLSAYDVAKERVWIITEWDRSVTTLLFPSEY
jgi:hypothetical protein